MKVLIISTSYPLSRNGSEAAGSFVEDFAQALFNNGVDVAVTFPVSRGKPQSLKNELTLFPFKVPLLPLSLLSVSNPLDWVKIIKTLRVGDQSVEKAINAFNPDFILALWALPSGYWALKHGRKYVLPYGIWALGSDIWSLGNVPVIKLVLKKVLNKSHINFADGYQLSRHVESLCNSSCHFLPSTRLLGEGCIGAIRSDQPFRLTYIGRWHRNKGIDILLDSLAILNEEFWSAIEVINIAGGGPLANETKRKATALTALGRPIVLSGYLDKGEVCEMLSETDFLLIPSRIESIPVVFSDAMQAGCPVITTPVGDLPELVKKYKCGVVADSVSVDSYAEALAKAVKQNSGKYLSGVDSAAEVFKLPMIIRKFNQLIRL